MTIKKCAAKKNQKNAKNIGGGTRKFNFVTERLRSGDLRPWEAVGSSEPWVTDLDLASGPRCESPRMQSTLPSVDAPRGDAKNRRSVWGGGGLQPQFGH